MLKYSNVWHCAFYYFYSMFCFQYRCLTNAPAVICVFVYFESFYIAIFHLHGICFNGWKYFNTLNLCFIKYYGLMFIFCLLFFVLQRHEPCVRNLNFHGISNDWIPIEFPIEFRVTDILYNLVGLICYRISIDWYSMECHLTNVRKDIRSPKTRSNIPMDKQLPYGD